MINLNPLNVVHEFGHESNLYKNVKMTLNTIFEKNNIYLESFGTNGSITNENNFKSKEINSSIIYLRLIIETILETYFLESKNSKSYEFNVKLLSFLFNKEDFIKLRIDNPEQDKKKFNDMVQLYSITDGIKNILRSYELKIFNQDLFGDLYQDLFQKNERHRAGEYYTPQWLVEKVVDEIWFKIVEIKNINKKIKILDPSCGSGSFLTYLTNRCISENIFTSVQEILDSIYGFDVNQLSLFMTKANIFLLINSNKDLIFDENLNVKCKSFKISDSLLLHKDSNNILNYVDGIKNNNYFNAFDIIIGNPPWITLRSLKDRKYQNSVKNEFFEYKLIQKSDTHLFTQLEIASLFYCKSIDLYLKEHGLISFIMPKSVILGTKHTEKFRTFSFPQSKLLKIWDLQSITNLFGMPTCVLFGEKGPKTTYPVTLYSIEKNNYLNKDIHSNDFNVKPLDGYFPPETKQKKSFYYNKFAVGASIFPRNLYFVEIINRNQNYIDVSTDPEINQLAKDQWKNISLQGTISKNFLYSTLLAWELVPFGYIRLRRVILPIKINKKNVITIVKRNEMDSQTTIWFDKTNEYWTTNNTEKSKKHFPYLINRLNYNNLLVKQNLRRFIVLYSGTGTNISCCTIDRKNLAHQDNELLPFISDVKTWIFETDSKDEAHYLCAILNSEVINELIKPLQPQGLGGGRAIHRRPLQFPINEYNRLNELHVKLATLSMKAHETVMNYIIDGKIKNRKQTRELINEILTEVNKITKLIMD